MAVSKRQPAPLFGFRYLDALPRLPPEMKIIFTRWTFAFLIWLLLPVAAPARELGWQPHKTWLFVVGVLSWKNSEMFGSFPVKNRRDAALVDFFKQSGLP